MFAKTPAGMAEQLAKGDLRQRPVNESDLQTSPSQDDGEPYRQQPGSVPVSQVVPQKNLIGREQEESDNTSSSDDD